MAKIHKNSRFGQENKRSRLI